MTKRHTMMPNGVWIYEVTLEGDSANPPLIDAATPRAVPEAAVVPCVSPAAMAQWLTILSADWAVRS